MTGIKFEDVLSVDHHTNALSDFKVCVVLESFADSRLDFKYSMTFEGNEPIEIHNPIYWLTVRIFAQNKETIPLEKKPPVLLLNLNREIDPGKDFLFIIRHAKRGPELVNNMDAVNQPLLNFEPGMNFTFSIQLDLNKQLKSPNRELKPYFIQFQSTIVPKVAPEDTKISRSIQTPYVPLFQ